MAKQRNIKVLYQVDTSQVTAATAAINKAKTATDTLNKSVKNLADTSQQNNKKVAESFETIRARMLALRDEIEKVSSADKARLNELIPKYKELKAQVDAFNKSLDGSAKGVTGVTTSLNGLYAAVRTVLVAGLIKETFEAALQMTALAGRVEGVKKAFDRLPNSVFLMEELRKRTHGALTEMELMQKALQAKNFGIPLENLGKLLEFAAIKSQQTGISIQYLTDSIVTGLGRESIKILDNLQIDIGKLKARMQETGQSMRVVVGEIVNEELKKMGGHIDTGETKVNRLKVAFEELRLVISKDMEQSGLVSFLTESIQGWTNFFESPETFGKLAQAVKESRATAQANVQATKDAGKNLGEEITRIKESVKERLARVEALKAENAVLFEQNKSFFGPQKQNTDEAKKLELNQRQVEAIEDKIMVQQFELAMLNELERSRKIEAALNADQIVTIKTLTDRIEKLNEQIEESVSIGDTKKIESLEKLRDQTEAYRNALLNLSQAFPDPESDPVFELTGELAQDKIDLNELLKEDTKRTLEEINRLGDQALKDQSDRDKSEIKQAEEKRKALEKMRKQLADFTIDAAHSVLTALNESQTEVEDSHLASLEKQLDELDDFYSAALDRTGNNTRAREEMEVEFNDKKRKLEKEKEAESIAADQRQKEREKKERLRQIAIDAAAGIIRALTISPGIGKGGGIAAGIIAGEAIIQTAVVNKFKKGVIDLRGPGTETSDSIPAMLSRRESVMTANETKTSGVLLKAIRAKKLDDRIFDKLIVQAQVPHTDFSPVVRAIQGQRHPDLVQQGAFTYSVIQKNKNLKQRIFKGYFSG